MSGNARRDAIGHLLGRLGLLSHGRENRRVPIDAIGVELMIWVQDDDPSMRRIAFDPGYKRCALWTRFEA